LTEIRLMSLKYRNFKGLRDFELRPEGKNANVRGDNATYKTTLADGWSWLLFDKDSRGVKEFPIKTLDENNEPIHGLEHEVEGVISINEKQMTLKKVFSEKWTKKRGQAKAVFTGHTTNYYINDVPVKKGEYEARIAELIDEKVFMLLTSPTYFNEQLHWTERRKTLLRICGDVSNEEVMYANEELRNLAKILGDRDIDEHRKLIASKKKKINDELEKIPTRIDEVERNLPDISGIVPDKLSEDIQKLKNEINKKQAELSRIENGGEIAEKTKQLRQVESELLQIENEFRANIETQATSKRRKIMELQDKIAELRPKANPPMMSLESLEKEIQRLRDKWHEVNSREFSAPDTCPTCGQVLPAEKIEEARTNFSRQKAEELERINAEGQEKRSALERAKAENKKQSKQAKETRQEIQKFETQIAQIKAEIDQLCAGDIKTPAYMTKSKEKATLEAAITDLKAGSQETVAKLQEEIGHFETALETLEESKQKMNQYRQGQTRIKELEAQEKQLAKEYEKLEHELYLTEEFIRTKVNLLEGKINSRFKLAKFKLFNQLVNGGVEECCETLYNGVPYSSGLNSGHRIIVGLDIINTLSEHYGFWAPIFIDNAESVTTLPIMKAQVIRLIKPEIETENDRKKYNKLNVEVCQ